MKEYIEGDVLAKQASNPFKGWTGQGYWMDLNNYLNKGDHWHQVRQYYILKLEGKIDGKYIKRIGSGNGTSFLFHREEILKYFQDNPKQLPSKRSEIPDLYHDGKMDTNTSKAYREKYKTYDHEK